jgi:hypothetical protein
MSARTSMRASNESCFEMVNLLLTSFVRVNIPPSAESNFDAQGMIMKKVAQTKWSFWSWLLGCGTGSAGGQG